MRPIGLVRSSVAPVCRVILLVSGISLLWIGLIKAADLSGFSEVVRQHGMIPAALVGTPSRVLV